MVGSMAGTLHVPFRSTYSSAKSALHTVADCLRYEVAPFGITVSTVEPGVIATGIETRRNRIVPDGSPTGTHSGRSMRPWPRGKNTARPPMNWGAWLSMWR